MADDVKTEAELKAVADQNGTEEQADGAALEALHAKLAAIEERLAKLEAAPDVSGELTKAHDAFQELSTHLAEMSVQFETVKTDVAALNSSDHGAPVQELAARVTKLEEAAPPDADTLTEALTLLHDFPQFKRRVESMLMKLRNMV
jgi:chromosome segregation ATPase